MNIITVVLVALAIIVILCAIISVEYRQIKKLEKRKTELEASYKEAQRNIAYLVKHQEEIAEIKTEEAANLSEIAGAKTDEEIFEIVNNIVALNNSKL